MAKSEVTISIKGPLFRPETDKNVVQAINTGLLELAEIEGSNNVKRQLKPGHGFKTGRLFRSISSHLIKDLHVQFNAGKNVEMGIDSLEYADKIEARYHMFANAESDIDNNSDLFDKYIGRAIEEAFS